MSNKEKTFHDQLDVERMWVASNQGEFIFISVLPLSIALIYMLWLETSQNLLLIWFTVINIINLVRWFSMRYYHRNKEILAANVTRFKWVLVLTSVMAGFWWGVSVLWFLEPSQPMNVLIMCLFIIVLSVGAQISWFCYLPALLAVIIPAMGSLSLLLFLDGGSDNMTISLVFCLLFILGILGSIKLARMLNHTLTLNFENVALRRESEEKSLLLETALENMVQGISMSDKDDRLRMWNRKFTNLLDSSGGKIKSGANLESILNAAEPPLKVHTDKGTEHRLPDGRVFEIRQSKLQHGGRVLTYTDISDLIRREQDLERARKTAEQANNAKTRFLAAASHDLRQPIHALGLFFAELSDRVNNKETNPLINQVNDSIIAINSMLNALLDVSKLDAGVVKPNIECFKLNDLFARLETDFMLIASENNNQLRIRPSRAEIVRSDSSMLEQMLRNLINNAFRYTQNGRVLVAARVRGEQAQILVCDNGPGIPEDQLDEIFIEFHQLGNPARDRRQGLGLGLAIVKRLATLLKHELNVSSRYGRGCCFCITVPLANHIPVESPANTVNINRAHSLAGCSVLVLDDDQAILEGMKGLLTRWGCQVSTACSPLEAFNQLNTMKNKPEIIIADYRLPDNISGIDIAKELQCRLENKASVLIITGDTGPERLQEADASGYPLLHKPVQPAKLRSSLQFLLNQSKIT